MWLYPLFPLMFFLRDKQNIVQQEASWLKTFIRLFSLFVSEMLPTRLPVSHFPALLWNYWIILNEKGKKVFYSVYPFVFLLTFWCQWYILSCLVHWVVLLFLDWITATVKCQNERNQKDLKYQHKLPGRICLTVQVKNTALWSWKMRNKFTGVSHLGKKNCKFSLECRWGKPESVGSSWLLLGIHSGNAVRFFSRYQNHKVNLHQLRICPHIRRKEECAGWKSRRLGTGQHKAGDLLSTQKPHQSRVEVITLASLNPYRTNVDSNALIQFCSPAMYLHLQVSFQDQHF